MELLGNFRNHNLRRSSFISWLEAFLGALASFNAYWLVAKPDSATKEWSLSWLAFLNYARNFFRSMVKTFS